MVKKIHLQNKNKIATAYCGRTVGIASPGKIIWVVDKWQSVTCKVCLKKFYKEKPYLKDMLKKGDIVRIGDSVCTVLDVKTVDNTFDIKYMKED